MTISIFSDQIWITKYLLSNPPLSPVVPFSTAFSSQLRSGITKNKLLLQDDLIDDVQSFVAAAEVLKERGAYKIYVLATHGLLSSDAPRLIEDSAIDEVVVTNTVPHELQKMQCHKIKTVDISILLSEAIRRIHNKESMSYLFKNVTLED